MHFAWGMECGRKKHGRLLVSVSSLIQGTAMLFLLLGPFFTSGLTLPTPIRAGRGAVQFRTVPHSNGTFHVHDTPHQPSIPRVHSVVVGLVVAVDAQETGFALVCERIAPHDEETVGSRPGLWAVGGTPPGAGFGVLRQLVLAGLCRITQPMSSRGKDSPRKSCDPLWMKSDLLRDGHESHVLLWVVQSFRATACHLHNVTEVRSPIGSQLFFRQNLQVLLVPVGPAASLTCELAQNAKILQ